MISHKHKCIFIHIPKCGGTTIKYLLFPNEDVSWNKVDYNKLYGWCPKRKFFLQHATAKQLLETELISEDVWKTYYKFTFVRNPWDRAVSDYFWLLKDQKIKDSFKNYIFKQGKFKAVLTHENELYYRGDHTKQQTEFFDLESDFKPDYIGKFENYNNNLKHLCEVLKLPVQQNLHINKAKTKKKHYSNYFFDDIKLEFADLYQDDIEQLGYTFNNQQDAFFKLKNYFKKI
ncbi:sulfotransferase family protein [Tamlana sp. 62-3]|uniref:Sulfotransferase family protein n=1 Tax=Neotamlana sargassicola TaxID=2883125 RepID=A0A9X1I8G5_9FLAO|nr:sulfotransferase family 2 domain-containing protein [Tamlana sargassicola]MCB4808724.1 sulfotransferase family protein [Tamlana sargassicola]